MPELPTYIPQELIALVADAVAAESEEDVVSSMAVGKVLTEDEMFALMDGEGQPEGLCLSANFDYNTKRYDGISLFAFQDGVPVEEVCIAKNISEYAEDM